MIVLCDGYGLHSAPILLIVNFDCCSGSRYAVQTNGNVLMAFNSKVLDY